MAAPKQADVLAQLESAQAEVHALRQQLEQAHRMSTLGTLAAGIAHEINNVITPGVAYGHLARSNPDDPDVRNKALQKALRSLDAAARIVQSMLGLASGDPGAGAVCVRDAVESALDYLPRNPRKDGIQIDIDVPAELQASIRPIALEQIILNLVLNACRALKPGGGLIKIRASQAAGEFILEISDNGPGIPIADQASIFRPFKSGADSALRPAENEGMGLGLSISSMLAKEAGGRIDLTSNPGDGAKFEVVLPLIEAESPQKMAG